MVHSSNGTFCGACGSSLNASIRFCTQCGAATASTPLPPSSTGTSPQFTPPAQHNRSRKTIALAVISPLAVIGVLSGGYYALQPKYDIEAQSLLAYVYNDQGRVNDLVSKGCSDLDAATSTAATSLNTQLLSYNLDYTSALDRSADVRSSTATGLNRTSSQILRQILGSRWDDVKQQSSIAEDFYDAANTVCAGMDMPPRTVLERATQVDDEIRLINNPPPNWQGSGFYQSGKDPNIGWSWASSYSYSCDWIDEGCVKILVKVRRDCPNVRVELGESDSRNAYVPSDTKVDYIYGLRKGKTYSLILHDRLIRWNWWSVESITCES